MNIFLAHNFLPDTLGKIFYSVSIVGYFILIQDFAFNILLIKSNKTKKDFSNIFVWRIIVFLFALILLWIFKVSYYYAFLLIPYIFNIDFLFIKQKKTWVVYFLQTINITTTILLIVLFKSEYNKDTLYVYSKTISESSVYILFFIIISRYIFKLKYVSVLNVIKLLLFNKELFMSKFLVGFLYSLDIIMIGLLLDNTRVAIYTIATKIVIVLIASLSAISMSFQKDIHSVSINNSIAIKKVLKSSKYKLFGAFLIIILSIFILKDYIIFNLYGKYYLENGSSHILGINVFIVAIVMFYTFENAFLMFKEPKTILLINIFSVILLIILITIFIYCFGFFGVPYAVVLTHMFIMFITIYKAKRLGFWIS